MTFELAISTMHKTKEECLEMLQMENIHCNCIVINQCDEEAYYEYFLNESLVRLFFTKERGLSKSRNMALKNMSADIMGIGDDDLYYLDNFEKQIIDYYESNQEADVVIFNMDNYSTTYSDKEKKCNFLNCFKYCSMQITFRKDIAQSENLYFDEYFGTGSGYVNSGEEQIFLSRCYKSKKKIYYSPITILKREKTESSWFKGFDRKFLEDRGAIYYAISNLLYFPLIMRFMMVQYKKIKPLSYINAYKMINQGKNNYKKYKKEKKDGKR